MPLARQTSGVFKRAAQKANPAPPPYENLITLIRRTQKPNAVSPADGRSIQAISYKSTPAPPLAAEKSTKLLIINKINLKKGLQMQFFCGIIR